ncbi:hypothetical protein PPERSA_01623 [Pseudocohnilembus persalinus]|uniref:Uncharacterized protein n=1 Tax=Pseudocohnilembus persalinus TaxID=266149 RepID=A0A0V0QHM8_PSEPJ|nr:hypothetical protein PPERSA_01623 [Pseudocohnilembus persalinus]|eukprot:KRX01753.1 hypothetical protein PPERSA_01623 [Pseudocohnilembus persalinus]
MQKNILKALNLKLSPSHLSQKLKHKFCYNNFEYYIPTKKLLFSNGRLKVFNYTQYNGVKYGCLALTSILALITYKCAQKIYHIKERNIIGIIFYTSIFFLTAPRLPGLPSTFSKIISHIHLNRDGKTVQIGFSKYGIIPTEQKIDIASIAKPTADPSLMIHFGFPILLNGEMYFLPKDNEDMDTEILPAIMNGCYIDVGESEEEISI